MIKKLSQWNEKISLGAWKAVQKTEHGQALSEYGVIVGVVVGILVVAVVIAFRDEIVASFKSATNALRSAR
jgi:Flp pilus assembly pilin Flp